MASKVDFITATIEETEVQRAALQDHLDSQKTATERNELGQFATPPSLALDMLAYAKTQLEPSSLRGIRFLEPGFGTGAFYSALLRTFPVSAIESAVGYEIDPHYGIPATALWQGTRLTLHITDFTKIPPPAAARRANLLLCNPPYVRHHHLDQDEKDRLRALVEERRGIKLSGLSGLYSYFICLAHDFLEDGGLAGWLVPAEFLDVNYGTGLKEYLLTQVTLLHIHRFDPSDVQFADAFVSSAIVWYKNTPPPDDHVVTFTFGGTLNQPRTVKLVPAKALLNTRKWNQTQLDPKPLADGRWPLSSLFQIKRGLATGSNEFFILTPERVREHQIPPEFLTPVLPSPRQLHVDEVHGDENGNPVIDPLLYLLVCDQPEEVIQVQYPTLWKYLQMGVAAGVHNGYLCRHRSPWYAQENRPAAPILCTYMGRKNKNGKAFRFILNHSRATATNVYLMLYPKPPVARVLRDHPELLRKLWVTSNNIPAEEMLGEGRVYGGGLYKLEPKELGNVLIDLSSYRNVLQLLRPTAQGKLFGIS